MADLERKLIIITAPSGAGKTSITRYLLSKLPQLAFSVSAATRKIRADEKDGTDYYFISLEEFKRKIEENNFVEWEMVYEEKYYGTLKSEIERIWQQNKTPVLDIDVHGAIKVKKQYPENSLSIFIEPPSERELKRRLQNRGTESLESLETRWKKAAYEISFKEHFSKVIVNDNLLKACEEAEKEIAYFLGLM